MARQPHRRPPSRGRPIAHRPTLRAHGSTVPPSFVEGLELRTLFAGISLAGDGTLSVVGTTGNDTISVNLSGMQVVAKLNATTKSFAKASVKKLSLAGDAGADNISVGATLVVPATIKGGPGNDTLKGGGGNDVIDGGTGADDVRGGPGSDTADYSSRSKPLYVQVEDVANDGEVNEKDNVHSDVENLTGGSAADRLLGNNSNNVLVGGGGNDDLRGFGGNDTLRGGDGGDQLDGGAGNDTLYGDGGLDTLRGGNGSDDFWGGAGGGGAGSYVTADVVDYSDHAGYVNASLDNQRNDGAIGENDYIHADVEGLIASNGGSTLIGNDAANYLVDGPGNDEIFANGGDDDLQGQSTGNDTFYGGNGDDHILSRAGNDKLYGGAGDDEIESYEGNDQLFGGAGHDWLSDYQGTNTLDGGPDADIVNDLVEPGILSISKSPDGQRLTVTGTGLSDAIGFNPVNGGAAIDVLYLATKVATVSLVGVSVVVVNAGGGDDSLSLNLTGTAVSLLARGEAGNDNIGASAVSTELYGDAGDDSLGGNSYGGRGWQYGGDGDDQLTGGDGEDELAGGAGNDWLIGGGGPDQLLGGDGDDFLDGIEPSETPLADYLDGGSGTDTARRESADALFSIEKIAGF